ncbi:cytochrome c-type biogenesis protein [Calderihabitans maritimus]|uniref:Cytochrome c-type biogenesis protein n=1 Tax=Calderihabitans maritimus TaxID=1246530 RepID=A0A1Z5HUT6_9FIRM|nr:cytochrome c-type biogenesis protein CcmH [Calderihabitans maritimus]GAW93050.1 cytochrome c biogenesis protein [Calderihabitans maritimus]
MRNLVQGLLLTAILVIFWINTPWVALAQEECEDIISCFMAPDFCGMTLDTCPASSAREMREEICRMVEQGMSKDEIIAHYVNLYGTQILAAPPKEGFFLTAWLTPVVILILGTLLLLVVLKNRKAALSPAGNNGVTLPEEELYEDVLQDELKKYI